jgi:exodeoxyribonuclease VII large subunit
LSKERTQALAARLVRCQTTRLAAKRRELDSLSRHLESVSYKSIVSRGFALVRGEDGAVRRSAAAVKAGEHLTLTFGDGVVDATATGTAAPKPKGAAKKPGGNQGSLF